MRHLNVVAIFACALAISACHKSNFPSVTGLTEAKSSDYFSSSPEITKPLAKKCQEFQTGGMSVMSPSEQKEWADSIDGINCRNIMHANFVILLQERNQRFEDQDRRTLENVEKKRRAEASH